jgi:endonuclease/exonuclease/phosphatase family metal-dependent hydrolase
MRRGTSMLVVASLVWAAFGAVAVGGDTVVIGTWNVWNLGAESDVAERAKVIAEFDIVALQEVEAIQGLRHLLSQVEAETGVDWEYVVSCQVGDGNAAEFYAFMYRTDRVSYVECSSDLYPEPTPDRFSREPFFATFRAGEFDFTLITVHITWGVLASLRTAECRRLAEVWAYVQDLDPRENDLILLGDFNRTKPTHSAFNDLEGLGLTALLTATGTRTTFGLTASGGSWYDHMWIDPTYTIAEWTGQAGTGTPSNDSSGAGCPEALKGVSDHCPVWGVFRTTTDDD